MELSTKRSCKNSKLSPRIYLLQLASLFCIFTVTNITQVQSKTSALIDQDGSLLLHQEISETKILISLYEQKIQIMQQLSTIDSQSTNEQFETQILATMSDIEILAEKNLKSLKSINQRNIESEEQEIQFLVNPFIEKIFFTENEKIVAYEFNEINIYIYIISVSVSKRQVPRGLIKIIRLIYFSYKKKKQNLEDDSQAS